jgi:tryptophanyl-tRNA synthetase
MTSAKPRIFSGIQPTSEMHIGNYFGAVENWVALQDSQQYECIYAIVDLHAITMPYEPFQLQKNTEEMLIGLLASGIDPQKSILFIQSMVPEHMELCWILSCITSFGELTRMTQFKDKSELIDKQEKGGFVSAGLFNYPVLQAADILIYKAKYVPVGKDQEQHLELSRNIAQRFNNRYGEVFPIPEIKLTETSKIMSPADPTKKMSKSLGNKHYIGLFEDKDSIKNKIKSAVTDTGPNASIGFDGMSPGVENLFTILKACKKTDEATILFEKYQSGTLKYIHLKDAVISALIELTGYFRRRREEIISDREKIKMQVQVMSERARAIARETVKEVREKIGLPLRTI